MNDKYLTVSRINRYIKYRLDNDENLQKVYLKGEISNFKKINVASQMADSFPYLLLPES